MTRWLRTQGLDLGDLPQDLLDEWLAAGASTRRSVNGFIDWLGRAHPSSRRLQVTWPAAAHNPPIAPDQLRLQALTVLLADHRVDARVRFAAAAVLLFAQPLTRIASLRRNDIAEAADGWQIRFGPRPVHAPALLDDLLAELTATVPGSSRTAAKASDWLLPGRKHGAHITSEELRRQLKVLAMPIRPGRRGAMLALAAELAARISPSTSASTVPAPRNGHAPPDAPTPITSPPEPSQATDEVRVVRRAAAAGDVLTRSG